MSNKHKRKGRGKFTMIDRYVETCAAWMAMKPVERNAYFVVKSAYDGSNNGRIGLGCRELAAKLNMSRNTANRALDALVSYGFIAVSKPSAFHVKNRAATEWRLTEFRCDVTGDLPSKEFMRWAPTKKQQSHPRDTQSHPRDCDPKKEAENTPHSPTHGTVNAVLDFSQSHPRDTYISTIPSSEIGTTEAGGIAQRAPHSAVASNPPGRRSPAQREQSKKYLSSLGERRASARETEAKRKADIEKLKAGIMGASQ